MALHPTISREAAVSLWELGWQESLEEDVIPMASTDYDYMDVQNGLRLWWESHLWASDCASVGRADLVMAMANLGPVGIWASLGSTVKELALKRAGIILLQDLHISKFSIASLKARLSFDFPQYHSIITTHSASEWEDGKRRKYHYAMVTLLHNHLYTDLNTETVHNEKSKEERGAVLGHLQVITARCKTLDRRVMIVNTYQHVARYAHRQQILWTCLDRFLSKQDFTEMSLIGGGDMNAAMDGQRFDYVTLDHEKSDQQFKTFAEQIRGDVVSPLHVTWWDQHRKSRAILDHVIVGNQSLARASTSVRNSCNPSHDHANVYVYARTTYLPGRPAVGGAVQSRQRIRMKAWSDKKAEWGSLSKLVLKSCMSQGDAHLSLQEFQECFKEILPVVIAEGVRLVGWTSPGMNRPQYRTQEVTKLTRKVRIMTAARRESYNITKESKSWTMAQKEAFAILSSPPPQLPIPEFEIERVREQFRSENSKLLKELKEITTKMEKENI
eukprot:3531277-Rhodomonas_salina.2